MKLGFLTDCMPERTTAEVVRFAADAGYQMLELACWPALYNPEFHGCHVDVVGLDRAGAASMRTLFAEAGMGISSLAYYRNNLEADLRERAAIHEHLKRVIDAAALLEVGLVGTFLGRDSGKTLEENLDEAALVFGELTSYAGDRGVRLMIENCPMVGWQQPWVPGNLFYSPALWDADLRSSARTWPES